MISIDTEMMQQLVNGCSTANDAIEEAVASLMGVTSHKDWGCKEKTAIDEYTITNKKKVQELQECSTNFLRALRTVTHDFESAENTLADMASNVDASIGEAISIPSGINQSIHTIAGSIPNTSPSIGQAIANVTSSVIKDLPTAVGGSIGAVVRNTIDKTISVCNFNDIQIMNK